MFAFAGDDIVWGGLTGDNLCGAKGDDFIVGGGERRGGETTFGDWIFGQGAAIPSAPAGATTSSGEAETPRTSRPASGTTSSTEAAGRTSSRVGPQADEIHGRAGDDTIHAGGAQVDHVFGDEGVDTCIVDEFDVVESCEVIEVV